MTAVARPIRQERVGWRDEALCGLGLYDEELWFSTRAREKNIAKQICLSCPVLDECTDYAVMSPVGHGIVAGMTPNQITKLRKVLRAAA